VGCVVVLCWYRSLVWNKSTPTAGSVLVPTPSELLARIRAASATPTPTGLVPLPLALGPRAPHPRDTVRDDCTALVDPIACDDDDEYERALDAAFAREVQRREAVGTRVAAALLNTEVLPVTGGVGQCPAGHPMHYDITLHEVRARCEAGCSAGHLAEAVEFQVAEYERHERATAQNEAASELAGVLRFSEAFGAERAQEWVIHRLVAKGGLTLLGGCSGDGKTFAAMHAGLCVATGTPWFDIPVDEARTLLVLLEGTAVDHRRRLRLLAAGLAIDPATLDGRLDIYPLTAAFRADEPGDVAALIKMLETLGHRFIIIDNLTTARGLSDENSAANLSAAMLPLARLAHERGIGILLLHHMNSRGELRGSSAIRQHADIVVELKRATSKNQSSVTMTRTKDRYGESFPELIYRLLDRRDEDDGQSDAIVPSRHYDHNVLPDDLAAQAAIPTPRPKPTGPRLFSHKHLARVLAALPATSEDMYKRAGISRRDTKAIRDQLELEGKIHLVGIEWRPV
jgi:hypothetical protein